MSGMCLEGRAVVTAGASVNEDSPASPADGAHLSRDEELKLCSAWREHGDLDARNRVVMAYMPLVMGLAAKHLRTNSALSKADLHQEATIGLIRAMENFDPDRGFRFSTYARWWVGNYLREATMTGNSVATVPRSANVKKMQNNYSKARGVEERLAQRRGEDVSSEEIRRRAADRIGVPRDMAETILAQSGYRDSSLNQKFHDDGEDSDEPIDRLSDDSMRADLNFEAAQKEERTREIIAAAMMKLKERERDVIWSRHLGSDRQTLATISERMGISRERVRQIEVAGLNRIMKAIKHNSAVRRDIFSLYGFE